MGENLPFASEGLDEYARLVFRVGSNLERGQDVVVWASVDHVPFARALTRAAYQEGARTVEVLYSDDHLMREQVLYGGDEGLGWTSAWLVRHVQDLDERRVALVNVFSPDFDAVEGLPGERVSRAQKREYRQAIAKSTDANLVTWSVVGYPTAVWARRVFGEPDVARLWEAIRRAVRLDEPDPVEAWRRHLDALEQRSAALTERHFDAVRFRGPGTDLTVGLLRESVWEGGASETAWGRRFVPNLPTEEVFTTPDCRRTEGTVRATRPVVLRSGTVVEGLELDFAGGRVTEARAASGEDEVRGQLAFDHGASMLGEVALVDAASRVGQLGVTFFNLLFDENALSHLAWGGAYLKATRGFAEGLSDEELQERGVNRSAMHTDFMVGSAEVEVDGIEQGGDAVPLLRGNEWQLR